MLQLMKSIKKEKMGSINNLNESYRCLIIVLTIFISTGINSCSNCSEKSIAKYIERTCDFSSDTMCIIDLRQALNMDFDSIYLFNGYDAPEYVDIFIKGKSKKLSSSFIYGNEDELMVFVKNKEVIKNCRLSHKELHFIKLNEVNKKAIFDNDTLTIYAKMYPKYTFSVTQICKGRYNLY